MLASHFGAALHVSAFWGEAIPAESLLQTLGDLGADKIELLTGDHERPAIWSSHGSALAALCRRVQPKLILFASRDGGSDLAARLAADLAGGFFAEAFLAGDARERHLERFCDGRQSIVRLRLGQSRAPTVVTLADRNHRGAGDDDADVRYIAWQDSGRGPAWLSSQAGGSPLQRAETIISVGAGVRVHEMPLIAELANKLGGEVAGTESAFKKGLVPWESTIGLGAQRVAPTLYVTVAASGSYRHLAAVDGGAAVCALNRDPKAPVFRAASYGVVALLSDALPSLLQTLTADAR
jgi:electron transfer flavoprotein alpha subunit